MTHTGRVEELVDAVGVRLCVEQLGDPADPTLVLVMGLGLDLTWWHDDLCALLVARGLHVVRFDNRDVGRSSRVPGRGPTAKELLRRRAEPVYSLEDMADDTAAVIRAVAPDGAHLAGASLGAFVAQATAIRHPDLVRSLTSIMGRPGDRRSGKTAKRMLLRYLRPAGGDPVESEVRAFRGFGSLGRTAVDDEDVRVTSRRSAARAHGDDGTPRQLAAILGETDRTPGLRQFGKPALVLHGDRDRIVLPSGGVATAAALPDAEHLVLAGMGHDLPRRLWPEIVDALERTVRRGE